MTTNKYTTPPFMSVDECPKCGAYRTQRNARWVGRGYFASQVGYEHMRVTCHDCGYVWFELPKDQTNE